MPVVPSLMVLYTNDAVEVRYSDGSRLQLSPCGASMFHQDPPMDDSHPLAGVNTVHKWTQFVTSAHKAKVLQALDFRNRFAQRPLLCPCLMPPEDVVSLYDRVDKVAWPKLLKDSTAEVLEDGSRRVVSSDEFATVVLSSHGQDFTVCYLSRISENTSKGKAGNQAEQVQWEEGVGRRGRHGSVHFDWDCDDNSGGEKEDRCEHLAATQPAYRAPSHSNLAGDSHEVASEAPQSVAREETKTSLTTGDTDHDLTPEELARDASGIIVSDGTMSTPRGLTNAGDTHNSTPPSKFNISPLQHDISSISRVSTPDGLRGMVECDFTLSHGNDTLTSQPQGVDVRHSSPVNLATIQKTAKRTNLVSETTVLEAPHHRAEPLAGAAAPKCSADAPEAADGRGAYSPKSDKACQTQASGQTSPKHGHTVIAASPRDGHSTEGHERPLQSDVHSAAHRNIADASDHRQIPINARRTESVLVSDGVNRLRPDIGGPETWSAVRQHYTWVTQHMSCSDCPITWRHPLKLLQQMDPSDAVLVTECHLSRPTAAVQRLQKTSTVNKDSCIFSPLVSPLPLTCPFQHLHAWQPHPHDDGEDGQGQISEFKQGQLKVIMMGGVVYRFVHLANMKGVEIYPGDGSVFVSQGITGHYFLRIAFNNGKLEEKTYSLKALPPSTPKSPYSIDKLIKRAHRFLNGCIQNSKLSEGEDIPCWKHVPTQVVEPLATCVLEDCTVPGYGRFAAYTNGRVRIVFDDRTALDMVSDFSGRIQGCLHHSEHEVNVVGKLAALPMSDLHRQLGARCCRLLLPAGKYVTLDIDKPGVYRRYVDAAAEWIQWVQSSPKDRRQFYSNKDSGLTVQMSAEAELKKIECFNYIVDHSNIKSGGQSGDPASSSLSICPAAPHPLAGQPSHISPPTAAYSGERAGLQCASHPPPCHGRLPHVAAPSLQSREGPFTWRSADAFHPPRSSLSHASGIHRSSSYSGWHAPASQTFEPSGGHQRSHVFRHSLLSDPKGLELMHGFNSVREALLRTSQMIKDIDQIVKDRKPSD